MMHVLVAALIRRPRRRPPQQAKTPQRRPPARPCQPRSPPKLQFTGRGWRSRGKMGVVFSCGLTGSVNFAARALAFAPLNPTNELVRTFPALWWNRL